MNSCTQHPSYRVVMISLLVVMFAWSGAFANIPLQEDQAKHQGTAKQQDPTKQQDQDKQRDPRRQRQQEPNRRQDIQQQRKQEQNREQDAQQHLQRQQEPNRQLDVQRQRQQDQSKQRDTRQIQRSERQRHEQQAEQQRAWHQRRATRWDSEHRNWRQRGGYNGYRMPDPYFHTHYGRDHWFRIYYLPFSFEGGYPRFQYKGYWFNFMDPYPEYWGPNWYETDDVYVDYYDDGYYLFNRKYPGRPGIAVSITF